MWEHSDAGLMLSLTAIPATHIFKKTVFDTNKLSVNNDGPTTYLTITAQRQQQ